MFGTIPNQFLHQQSLDFSFSKFLQSQINVTASPQTEEKPSFQRNKDYCKEHIINKSKVGGISQWSRPFSWTTFGSNDIGRQTLCSEEGEEHSCPSSEYPKILPTAGFPITHPGNKRINSIAGLCGQKQFYSAKVSSMLPLCRIAPPLVLCSISPLCLISSNWLFPNDLEH